MRRWTIVNVLLVMIVALLAFEIVRTWARGLPPIEKRANAPVAAAPVEPHEKGKRGASDKGAARAQQTPAVMVSAIAEKDLFDPSRHPPTPEETKVESAPVTKPPEGVTVVGIRIFGKDREVFVNDTSQNPPMARRLRQGDQVSGYTIKVIEPTGIVLTSPSGDAVGLALTLDKGKAAPPPGQRPPGVPGRVAPAPGKPGQPAPAPGSPAAGPQGASPAAGVAVKPTTPPPIPPRAVPQPAAPPPAGQEAQKLPAEVKQKLEHLRQSEKRSGRKR